jgi:hypothetical protein
MTSTTDADRMRRLRFGNVVVGLVHLAQAAAILALSNSFAIPISAAFQNGPPGAALPEPDTIVDVRYGIAVALFLGLAALDHLLVAAPGIVSWYERNLRNTINYARWIEYSMSASIMVVLIAMLTGITNLYALIGLFGANAAMILFGLLMERTNQGRDQVDWWPFVFGSIIGTVPWIAIGVALGGAQATHGGVPGFVFGIFVSLFVFFNSFAINQFLQYRKAGKWSDYLYGEKAYILLSLGAKSALAWQVFGGTLAS